MQKLVLQVDGMKCGGCETLVKDHLESASGVYRVSPNHQTNQVAVELDSGKITVDQIKQLIVDQGYTVRDC